MGLSDGVHFTILLSLCQAQYRRVTDGRTDRRTDRHVAVAKTRASSVARIKMRENPLVAGAPARTPMQGELTVLPRPPSCSGDGAGCPLPKNPTPAPWPFGPPTLALRASFLASPNPFTKIRLCSELNFLPPPPL